MPKKKHLSKGEPPAALAPTKPDDSGVGALLDAPDQPDNAVDLDAKTGLLAGGITPQAIRSENVRERSGAIVPPRDSLQTVTQRLGARFWATNKRFDWALNASRHHYEFTRYYFEQLLLVDVWPNSNPSARKESERKRACVDAENERRVKAGMKPIGFISIVRGAVISDDAFARGLQGETIPLIERASEGLLV
jgi:hypothetical protein